jgi:hypothetical protein
MATAHPPSAALTEHRERLFVPVSWWIIAAVFLLSLFVAVAFYLGPWTGVLVAVVSVGIVAAVLLPYGSLRITVDDTALTVGPNRIEWPWVGGASALDRAETRRRLGPGADARAYLVTRPYLSEAVEIDLADPADPHPYWLVSSRHAVALAATINAHAAAPRTPGVTDG